MSETLVIKAGDLGLTHRDGRFYGPLSFSLAAGEGLLIEVPFLDLLRRLMRCCQGTEEPGAGHLDWDLGVYPDEDSRWARYDFFRRIGFVDRDSQLLNALTLRHNLELYFGYARLDDPGGLAAGILKSFDLEDLADLRGDELPEPSRRLALYALALAKKPRLMLMERPLQFLDRDYEPVRAWVKDKAESEGLAYIIFDRDASLYSPDDFKELLSFS